MNKKMNLFYILKVNTSKIVYDNYDLELEFNEAKELGLVVSLGDNQLLKFIRRLNNIPFDKNTIDNLYNERNRLKTLPESKKNSKAINKIQNQINELLFIPDLVSVKVDTTKKDYKYICKNGFVISININDKTYKMKYKRLCAGAGQLRRNSAFFVNEEIYNYLEQIMMCGLTKNKIGKINLAKFSAYYALYTSATNEVRSPRICVIKDFEYTLKDQKVAWIFDNNGEKDIENRIIDLEQNAFDGSGIVSVEMAKKWQVDLGLDYLPSSFIIRSAWIKGLVSIFDFRKFAKEIACTDTITDAWGQSYNINDIDVILTTSQFKMWKKYSSWLEYTYYHRKFGHIYGIARVNKKENNFLTPLNYQYIQSNNFTEDSIKDIADFSINWVKKIMTGDKLYTMLFLIGDQGDSDYSDIENKMNSCIPKVLMYNDSILNDSYIRQKINNMIDNRVNQIKIGKIFVEGSYDFAIPDLYALCEHAFGLEVKGLLKEKESWNKRWVDKGTKVVSMQRSPLVAPSENQLRYISLDSKCNEWFSYIQSGMIMSIWDSGMMRCSDADYDGDIVLSSDNKYLIDAIDDNLCPITYEKKKAKEQRLNFNSFANMDSRSFNSKIGFITNLASTFIAMLSSYPVASKEYKELKKRIDLLRFYQGSAIDATKGDIFTPPPKEWSKKVKMENYDSDLSFKNRIAGDKKPYFFGYVYPKIMKEYKRHKANYKKMCKLMYACSLYDLMNKPDKTKEERIFIQNYYKYTPLLMNKCTMNVLATYVEDIEFDNKWKLKTDPFDYHILMSKDYNLDDRTTHNKIKNVIAEFTKKYNSIIREKKELDGYDDISVSPEEIENYNLEITLLMQEYESKLLNVCSNEVKMVDYLIDIYYKNHTSQPKTLLWGKFGDIILNNVKSKSDKVCYPVLDENGVEYLGKKYSLKEVSINNDSV